MRSLNSITSALLLVTAALVTAPALAATQERALEKSWPAAEVEAFRFDISVAELEIAGESSDTIRIEVYAECSRQTKDCAGALEELELSERMRGKELIVELEGFPKWGKGRIEVETKIMIPAGLDLELDMGVGEINIEGLRGNLDVDLGVGEITIDATPATLRSVNLDVGVGEAEIYGKKIHLEGRRSFLVGSEVYWADGKGEKTIKVDLGVGEATVHLD